MIIWLTGHSGSGKTTIAKLLAKEINAVILDGNEMRESISTNSGFSREDREEHNLKVARLAKVINEQMNVVVSVIAPMKGVRDKINEICNPTWIYLKRSLQERENHFYEVSDEYFFIDNDKCSINENVKNILNYIKK